jgi:peptide/nickel transport system ATP-binding protein
MSVLEIRSLTTSLLRQGRWTPVVQDVSLDVDARETVAIVGESGSGKSVTMLSVMRLLPERLARISGSVLLNGRDLLSLTESEMETVRGREAAVIFQEPMTSLNPVLTVGRQISETMMRHRGIGEAEAEAQAIRLL